jgi:hypothetical protein
MWPETPEQRLQRVNDLQARSRAEAAADRMARSRRRDRDFSGIRVHLGSFIIVVGRSLCDETTSPQPARF